MMLYFHSDQWKGALYAWKNILYHELQDFGVAVLVQGIPISDADEDKKGYYLLLDNSKLLRLRNLDSLTESQSSELGLELRNVIVHARRSHHVVEIFEEIYLLSYSYHDQPSLLKEVSKLSSAKVDLIFTQEGIFEGELKAKSIVQRCV